MRASKVSKIASRAFGGLGWCLLLTMTACTVAPPGVSVATPTSMPQSQERSTTFDPSFVRIMWTYLQDRNALIFEDEVGGVRALRITRPSGAVVGSESARAPLPGEPRTCGHPSVIRPLVAVIPVQPEIGRTFQSSARKSTPGTALDGLRVEVQTESGGSWHPVVAEQLLDRKSLANTTCFE